MWIGAREVAQGEYVFTDGSTYDYHVPGENLYRECLRIVYNSYPEGRSCGTPNYDFICMSKALNYKGE